MLTKRAKRTFYETINLNRNGRGGGYHRLRYQGLAIALGDDFALKCLANESPRLAQDPGHTLRSYRKDLIYVFLAVDSGNEVASRVLPMVSLKFNRKPLFTIVLYTDDGQESAEEVS